MGIRINTNVSATNTARVLRKSNLAMQKSLERLSSGLRINRAADDAAGLAIAENFRSQVRGYRVAQRNVQDGISLIQTKEGAMSEITNIMQRMREIAVQSANGTNSAENRTDLDNEYQELSASITEILGRTTFNGIDLFGGTLISVQSGAFETETTNLLGSDTIISAASLSAGGAVNTQANADIAIGEIDAGLLVLNSARAELGAAQNRLEFTSNVLGIREENAMAAESAIRDADIARETTQFTRNQILVNAGTSMLAQANFTPQTSLQLLA